MVGIKKGILGLGFPLVLPVFLRKVLFLWYHIKNRVYDDGIILIIMNFLYLLILLDSRRRDHPWTKKHK